MIVNDKSSERVPNVENLIAVASLSPCFTDDLLGLQYDNGISVDTSMLQETNQYFCSDVFDQPFSEESYTTIPRRIESHIDKKNPAGVL